MQLVRYTSVRAQEWDRFISQSKNGTLLFLRGYMDYHSDRFSDHSLMYYSDKGKLMAVMPANEHPETGAFWSHQGLTYGGFVLSGKTNTVQMMALFDLTLDYLRQQGFKTWHYKQIPSCYHRCPSEEDEYALWRHGAILEKCLLSTTIPLNGTCCPKVERRRRRGQRKALSKGYTIAERSDVSQFWPIVEQNLSARYKVRPVHTAEEMQLLMQRFPDRIKCFLAEQDGRVEAGCIIYLANDSCIHVQYGHATMTGKDDGALDLLYLTMMEKYKAEGYRFMDFGNSNEDEGHYLNEGLVAQKEGFGGRAVVYREYRLSIVHC